MMMFLWLTEQARAGKCQPGKTWQIAEILLTQVSVNRGRSCTIKLMEVSNGQN